MDVNTAADAIVNSQVWKFAAIFILSYFILSGLNVTASTLFSFFLLKTDEIGISTEVEYQRKKWRVLSIGIRRIRMESLEEHYEIMVHTKEWRSMHIIIKPSYNPPLEEEEK